MHPARPLFAIALAATIVVAGAGVATADVPAPVTERLVVEFQPGTSAAERADALDDAGLELVEPVDGVDFAVVEARVGDDVVGGAIVDADRPVTVRALTAPDDPSYPSQWSFPVVQAEQAWALGTGSGAVVAVVDTGVSTSADFSPSAFVAGYDFVDNDSDPSDPNGHGTHVAGTIAQATNNGTGAAGLAYSARIMPLRVLNSSGSGSDYAVAQAIDYAVANGADIVNLSLGGPSPSSVLQAAVRRAAGAGLVVVAAAGNSGGAIAYPAAYTEAVAVGAVDTTLNRASFSNYGPQLDLVAPGVSIRQGMPNGSVQSKSGTSMATPHVSAAAAILVGRGVAGADVRGRLESTAADLGPSGRDDQYGAGLLQIAAAASGGTVPTPLLAPGTPTGDDGSSSTTAPAPAPAPAPGPEPTPIDDDPNTVPPVQDIDDACPDGAVPRGRFPDVDPASVHARAVDCVSWLAIASGTSGGAFAPSADVTRAQMATFLARALEHAGVELPAEPVDAFADDDGSPHEHAINQLAALGVVRGAGPGTYGPGTPVSRAGMASFLVAVHDRAAEAPLPPGADRFSDDNGNVHEEAIASLARAGIATGTAPGTFQPGVVVSRGQLATFLARTIDALLDQAA